MNKYKKITVLICGFLTALSIAACGQAKEDETAITDESVAGRQESNVQTAENIDLETKEEETVDAEEPAVNQQENGAREDNAQTDKDTDSEMTAEELLDLFIAGSVNAVDSADSTSTFYITDLNMDSEEWDSYSVGEKVDLDNDGENELIICGPYGGMYLDARDNKIYEFAAGDGNAIMLSYVVYNGSTWIMYSNCMNAGYKAYHMEKFEGADNLVAEINFSEESVDENNTESGMKYTLNGTEISYDEYTALCSKIFATEVTAN